MTSKQGFEPYVDNSDQRLFTAPGFSPEVEVLLLTGLWHYDIAIVLSDLVSPCCGGADNCPLAQRSFAETGGRKRRAQSVFKHDYISISIYTYIIHIYIYPGRLAHSSPFALAAATRQARRTASMRQTLFFSATWREEKAQRFMSCGAFGGVAVFPFVQFLVFFCSMQYLSLVYSNQS